MKEIKNNLSSIRYGHFVIAILFLAFAVRLSFFMLLPGELSPDARSYYTAALNLANGNGYSDHLEPPFLPFYFREPFTSYAMSLFVRLWIFFSGSQGIVYPTSWFIQQMEPCHQHIILLIRIGSSLLQLFGLLLFSSIVRKHSTNKVALVFLLISAVSTPLVVYSSLLLREVYLFFLLMLISWFWDRFIFSGKWRFLLLTAFTGGCICLCLHVYWLLLLFFIPILIIHLKRQKKRIGLRCLVFIIAFFLPVVPWVIRVYHYYPDIRVAKTLGSGLTPDYVNGLNAYRAFGVDPYFAKQGDLPRNIPVRTEIFSIDDVRKNFQYTFDGTYKKEAARINAENTTKAILNYYLYGVLPSFRNTVFIVGITYDYGVFNGHFSKKDIAKFLLCFPGLLMGLLALIGLWPIIKRYWMIMPAFLYNSLFFFAFGDEERRQYVLVPWIIIMSMYAVWQIIVLIRRHQIRL